MRYFFSDFCRNSFINFFADNRGISPGSPFEIHTGIIPEISSRILPGVISGIPSRISSIIPSNVYKKFSNSSIDFSKYPPGILPEIPLGKKLHKFLQGFLQIILH